MSCTVLLSVLVSHLLQPETSIFTHGKCGLAGDNCVLWLGSQTVIAYFETHNYFSFKVDLVKYSKWFILFNEYMAN